MYESCYEPGLATLENVAVFQVLLCFPEHPYRKREFEVWIRNGTSFVKDTFDGFLCP